MAQPYHDSANHTYLAQDHSDHVDCVLLVGYAIALEAEQLVSSLTRCGAKFLAEASVSSLVLKQSSKRKTKEE